MDQSTLIQAAPNCCVSTALPHSNDPMQFYCRYCYQYLQYTR